MQRAMLFAEAANQSFLVIGEGVQPDKLEFF
jgi:hypothetical protein